MNAPSSSLGPGSRLGPYEIRSHLGSGAMGEVYLARDPRLGREVAIKVLPADRLTDVDRRRRFVLEARAASALNHPGIVTIHEIDAVDGIDFIVMEYVAGHPLSAMIPSQGMRLADVLALAIPMAEALSRAHAAGIVHRDLKPANVMVGREGVVKILDFGLAKLVSPDGAVDERDTTTMDAVGEAASRSGRIAGTPAYMSPEQATGGKVDARSDVFSFGALLYEMVTGRRPFAGATTEETLAAVARDPPRAPGAIVTGLPHDLEKLILRCLQKDPDRRFQSMLDLRVELREIQEELSATPAVGSRRHVRSWAAVLVVITAVAVPWAIREWRRPELPPPKVVPLTSSPGDERDVDFSPDGEQIVFSWDGGQTPEGERVNYDIWLKMIGGAEVRRLSTDPKIDRLPAWSPDGKQIAFVRSGVVPGPGVRTIYLISPLGGAERKFSDFPAAAGQVSWSPDGRWLAVGRSRADPETTPPARGIYLISVAGGEYRPLTAAEAPAVHREPAFSPDGRSLAYASVRGEQTDVYLVSLDERLVATGAPRMIARNVGAEAQLGGLRWSRDGKSVLLSAQRSFVSQLDRVTIATGRREAIELAGRDVCCPATVASRDRLAYEVARDNVDIYRWYSDRTPEPMLQSSFADFNPSFSPDGRRIAFSSGRSGQQECWLADADGANPTQLTRGPGGHRGGPRWSADGRRLVYSAKGEDGHFDVWTIDADGGSARRLTDGPGDSRGYGFSRDGRFVYFSSDRDGMYQIWRVPAEGGSAEKVTHNGGFAAAVSPDGETLVYSRPGVERAVMALALDGGRERPIAPCVELWGFAVTNVGVYYLACAPDRSEAPLHVFDLTTGVDRVIGAVPTSRRLFQGMSVSPDGTRVVFSKYVTAGTDLMMIDNFR